MGAIEIVLIIILIAALFGSYPGFGWAGGIGYGPFGAIFTLILVLLLLKVLGVV